MKSQIITGKGDITIPDPPLAHLLFSTTRFAWLFAIIRIYVGYQWITAGYHKLTGGGWIDGGTALKGFWTNAVKVSDTGKAVITYDWYRSFLQFMLDNGWYSWFAPLVAGGEFLVGVGLILGAFVGIAAFFGGFLNWNFLMAGTASTNGMLFALAIVLILAWKVAGWYGLDRWLLPILGTPWRAVRDQTPSRPQINPV